MHATADEVADALTARLLARLAEIQRDFRVPQVGADRRPDRHPGLRRAAPKEGPHSAVDWSRVELWWGDERFVPADDGDRNAKQTLDLLAAPLRLDPDRVHQMPAERRRVGSGPGRRGVRGRSWAARCFDICLLGLGPDGHVASLFPEHPSSYAEGDVIAVRSSPKPPPERISLTLPVINRSHEVWFVVSGSDKAAAAKMALLGAGPVQVPGRRRRPGSTGRCG